MDAFTKYLAVRRCFIKAQHSAQYQRGNSVTYYRVDFVAAKLISRPAKRFVSEEKAKQHARRVLGVHDDTGLLSRVAIVAVSKDGTPVQR